MQKSPQGLVYLTNRFDLEAHDQLVMPRSWLQDRFCLQSSISPLSSIYKDSAKSGLGRFVDLVVYIVGEVQSLSLHATSTMRSIERTECAYRILVQTSPS